MLDSGTVKPGASWKSGLGYFRKVFRSARDRLHKEAHDRELAERTAEGISAEKLHREQVITEKAANAFERSAEITRAEKAKRTEAMPAGMNGRAHPSASGRDFVDEHGRRRYYPHVKLIAPFGNVIVTGEHANKLLDEMEASGATFEDFDKALGEQNGLTEDNAPLSRDTVLGSVRRTVNRALQERCDLALQLKFGPPEKQLAEGHTPHSKFRSRWLCLSVETVAAIVAQCPDVEGAQELLDREFDSFIKDDDGFSFLGRPKHFKRDDNGEGLQQRAEKHFTAVMLAKQGEAQAIREKLEQEAAQREAKRRHQREQAEHQLRQWEAERPEREARERAQREEAEAKQSQQRAAQEADAANLQWNGINLTLTEAGTKILNGIDKGLVDIALAGLTKTIWDPIAKRTSAPGIAELAPLWRDLVRSSRAAVIPR
jgi:hypothetical protein